MYFDLRIQRFDRGEKFRRVARTAWHQGNGLAGGFPDDVIKELFIFGHGPGSEKPAAWSGHPVHLFDGERHVFSIINGKAAGNKIKKVTGKGKFLIEIQEDELHTGITAAIFGACLIEQVFRDIPAGDFCITFEIVII